MRKVVEDHTNCTVSLPDPLKKEDIVQHLQSLFIEMESFVHGKTTGGDVKTVVSGGALRIEPAGVTSLPIEFPFSVIIVDTGVRAKTADTVAAVRALYEQGSGKDVIDKIGTITQEIAELISTVDIVHDPGFHTKITQNHQLLCDIGLNVSQTQEVVDILEGHGVSAKLSGKGMGGIVIGFVESAQSAEKILADLQSHKFKAWVPQIDEKGIFCSVENCD